MFLCNDRSMIRTITYKSCKISTTTIEKKYSPFLPIHYLRYSKCNKFITHVQYFSKTHVAQFLMISTIDSSAMNVVGI